jgi:hypothetical protein
LSLYSTPTDAGAVIDGRSLLELIRLFSVIENLP